MATQTEVPGIGKVKKQYVFAGVGISAGIVGYAWWRARSAATAVPGEGDVSQADLIGSDGSPDSFAGAVTPGGSTVVGTVPGAGPPLTNAEWTQRVVDMLSGVGYDSQQAADTIGKYLSGQPLTATEKILVQAAIGLLGPPPAGALPIISAPDTPSGGTPPPSGGGTTPPPSGTKSKLATPSVRAVRADTRGRYRLTWNKIPGATFYTIKKELPAPVSTGPWAGTSWTSGILKHGFTYQYRVQAHAPGKNPSDWSAPVRFRVG